MQKRTVVEELQQFSIQINGRNRVGRLFAQTQLCEKERPRQFAEVDILH